MTATTTSIPGGEEEQAREQSDEVMWRCRESGREFTSTRAAIDYVLSLGEDEAHDIIPIYGDGGDGNGAG